MRSKVCVAGYFPPPITGQTMATRRLADLISPVAQVNHINLIEGHEGSVETKASLKSGKIRRYLRGGKKLKSYLKKQPTDLLLWTSISPQPIGHLRDILTIYPSLTLPARVYALSHWGNFDRLFSSPATSITSKLLINRLGGIVFLNQSLADKCTPWLPVEKQLIIPNTIDDTLLTAATDLEQKRATRQTRTALHLLFLSNMIASKGYQDVLEAVKILHDREINIKTRFAGRWISSEDHTQFETFVRTHNLGSVVEHLGPISERQAVKELHLWADIFLFPTYYPTEAQPLVLLEAMNAGTPIITTAHSGIPEMITEDREGLFVPAKSPVAIADAVSSLRDLSRWTRLSEGAFAKFNKIFSPTSVQNQWESLIYHPSAI